MSARHVSINFSLRTWINSTLLSDAGIHNFTFAGFCMHINTTYCRKQTLNDQFNLFNCNIKKGWIYPVRLNFRCCHRDLALNSQNWEPTDINTLLYLQPFCFSILKQNIDNLLTYHILIVYCFIVFSHACKVGNLCIGCVIVCDLYFTICCKTNCPTGDK